VAAEIALAVVVVIGASLLMRSFWTLRHVDPGFDPRQVLAIDLSVPQARYTPEATTIFYQRAVERMRALPGVRVAAAASDLPPVASGNNWDVFAEGRDPSMGERAASPNMRAVTHDYFRALGVALVRGRVFGAEDGRSSVPVAVVNEATARAVWPGKDPVGQRLRFSPEQPWVTVVGVARDARSMGLGEPAPPEIYLLHEQLPALANTTERAMYVVLRTAGDPAALTAPARRVVRELDPELAILGVRTMQEMLGLSLARPRFTMLLLGAFGTIALALAAIGIYGVMSYSSGGARARSASAWRWADARGTCSGW
jgi:predicted permease